MTFRCTRRPVLAVLALTVLLGACSDDGGSGTASNTADAETAAGAIVALCAGHEAPNTPASTLLTRDRPSGTPEEVAAEELRLLAAGLTGEEREAGLLVPWPEGTDVVPEVSLDGGSLVVDFPPAVTETYVAAPGSSSQFFVPLLETAFRRPEVDTVDLVIDGSPDRWEAWWQGSGNYTRDAWRASRPEPQSSCPPPGG